MSDLEKDEGEAMVNPRLKEAALAAVNEGRVQDGAIAVEGYPGMFVAKSNEQSLQAMDFFEVNGVRYTFGPMKK